MTGEMGFDELFFYGGGKPDPILWVIFIIFVLVLNIILMNLLVSIREVKENVTKICILGLDHYTGMCHCFKQGTFFILVILLKGRKVQLNPG